MEVGSMVMLFYWGVRSRLFGTEGGEGKVERREGGGGYFMSVWWKKYESSEEKEDRWHLSLHTSLMIKYFAMV